MRYIGIRHRVKATKEGEARPTQVCIMADDAKSATCYNLGTETDELDWLLGRYPETYRLARLGEDLSIYQPHQIKWRKPRNNDDLAMCLIRDQGKNKQIAEVPDSYDGLRPGDRVCMALGGSGDRLAFALSRRGEEIGDVSVYRIPPAFLKTQREVKAGDKDADAMTLVEIALHNTAELSPVMPRDRNLIVLQETLRARTDAMKARIGCEQRLRQQLIGKIFCSEEGRYPEGSIEALYDEAGANDAILQALVQEEKSREKDLVRALERLDVYKKLLQPIEGVGPMISARLIAAVGDIRRFDSPAKLKAFVGAHVLQGGKNKDVSGDKQFPRRRGGMVANWHPNGRQALYLLVDQFNRRPDSEWGQRLLKIKQEFRRKHPEPIQHNSKARYTDGHIHKMALWRTATKFVEWLWREWQRVEARA